MVSPTLDFEYQIKKSKRKTFAITIDLKGQVVVRSPFRASQDKILNILNQHQDWVRQKIHQSQQKANKVKAKKFVTGEKFLYLGKQYKLEVIQANTKKQGLALVQEASDDGKFILNTKTNHKSIEDVVSFRSWAKVVFESWYQQKATEIITTKVESLAKLHQINFNKIGISKAKTSWGSCSKNNCLRFSWRLIMAPPKVIDYVAIHELCHVEHKNHSQIFWQKVALLFPEFQKAKSWLKNQGYLLEI